MYQIDNKTNQDTYIVKQAAKKKKKFSTTLMLQLQRSSPSRLIVTRQIGLNLRWLGFSPWFLAEA